MRTLLVFAAVGLAGAPVFAQSFATGPHHDPAPYHVLPAVDLTSPLPAPSDVYGEAPLAPLEETFNLSSRPSATKTIYLDFDGHTTQDPWWEGGRTLVTPAFSIDGDASSFSASELQRIQYIWQRVVEDFSPFDVNVTTKAPPAGDLVRSGGGDTRWGIRAVIGPNWGSTAGGLALGGTFTMSRDTPTFIFSDNLGNGEKNIAEAASHEIGHTLGLHHDGRTSPSEGYYAGHGSGPTGWAPIMGVGYYQNLTQWSKGEYANADQLQDDLQTITTQNGFGYRPDDHGDFLAAATPLTVTGDTAVSAAGVISTRTDRDLFSFDHGGGVIDLTVDPFDRGPNLDILAELLDAAGNLLMASNPLNELYARIAVNLLPGTYYLRVDGVGRGNPLAGGYSDYGSLGQYFVSGVIGAASGAVPEPATAGLMGIVLAAVLSRRGRS